jgi:hypothetical protein
MAEILGFDSIQEGTTSLEDSTFGGATLGISARNFRRGFYSPRSIILQDLVSFGGFQQLGQNILSP